MLNYEGQKRHFEGFSLDWKERSGVASEWVSGEKAKQWSSTWASFLKSHPPQLGLCQPILVTRRMNAANSKSRGEHWPLSGKSKSSKVAQYPVASYSTVAASHWECLGLYLSFKLEHDSWRWSKSADGRPAAFRKARLNIYTTGPTGGR